MQNNLSVVGTARGSFSSAHSDIVDNSLPPGAVGEEEVKRVIRAIAGSRLHDIPLRLLNTQDGKIYTGVALRKKFEDSDKFQALLTLTTTRSILNQKQYIDEVVHTFFEYVMLSHRWEDDELAFKDVKEGGIYNLSASRFGKVRNFCIKAREHGFDWAWIDTCCIDQTNNVEVQESISSMFAWYRGSALTIIYLSDVTTCSIQALKRSRWFRRGWTLQELLAARFIQLYKGDWNSFSQYAAFNHKDVDEILEALGSATGIERGHIKCYSQSIEHPREKLTWARLRRTRKKEDEAYSLMRIFGFTMQVSYGEGYDAFARLLMEIMKRTADATLLDWVGRPSSLNSCLPSSPTCFSDTPFGTAEMQHAMATPLTTLSFPVVAKLVWVFKGIISRARNSIRVNNNHATATPLATLSFPVAVKLVCVFKGIISRARNSIRVNNTRQEPSGGRSSPAIPVSHANGAPRVIETRTRQNFLRSASLPNEFSLDKLLELKVPPWPYRVTAEIHITVPCFVHEVQSLHFEPVSRSYYCRADGIRPFRFVTSVTLETWTDDDRSQPGYLLARPWDPRLLHVSSDAYSNDVSLLCHRLASPFFAMLLEPSDYGRFKRIPTEKRIVAQLRQPPSQTYGVRFLDLQ